MSDAAAGGAPPAAAAGRVRHCPAAGPALARAAAPFELLVADMVLPDGNGANLAERLRARRSGPRVLFVSAYSERTPLTPEGKDSFLAKPFSPQDLALAVREALEASPGPGRVVDPWRSSLTVARAHRSGFAAGLR